MQWGKTYLPSIALCSSSASFSRVASSSFALFSAFLSVFLFSLVAAEGLVFALSFAASFLALSAGFSAGWKTNQSVKAHKKKRNQPTNKRQLHVQRIIFTFCCFLAFSFPLPECNKKKTNKRTKQKILMSHQVTISFNSIVGWLFFSVTCMQV